MQRELLTIASVHTQRSNSHASTNF